MLLILTFLLNVVPESVLPITNADGKVTASAVLLNKFTAITAAHAVGPERSVVFLQCGKNDVAALVSKRSSHFDLALMTLLQPCRDVHVLDIAERDPIEGDDVEIVGYPSGKLAHVAGKVRGYTLFGQKGQRGVFWLAMVVATDVRPGNSGGPVISKFGKLVGVVHGYHEHSEGKPGVVVPLSAIAQFLAESDED